MQTFKTRTIAILGAAVLGTGALSIGTAAQADVNHAAVSYADLDVNSHDGRKLLVTRVNRAADEVCGMDNQNDRFDVAACRSKALEHAYADLEARGVTIR